MTYHYWDMETRGLNKQRAEVAYRVFDRAVRLLGGEVSGGGYGDVAPVATIPIKDAVEAVALWNARGQNWDDALIRWGARITAIRTIRGWDIQAACDWVERNFPD